MRQFLIAAMALGLAAGAADAQQRCYVGSKNGRVDANNALIACDQVRGGGQNILVEKGYGIIKYGPDTYDNCVLWAQQNEDN
ncbi:hypothetical protein [Sagittula salina]|uniref:Uncharacterized protein n=1 Tax=Sagittula salina TaxID=2820268 RepID=A0A940MLD5_9RHOB|nr:hypothetical protein [Sagittula salina]MBP0481723.1 hypothetical protein [Sagittula salina]